MSLSLSWLENLPFSLYDNLPKRMNIALAQDVPYMIVAADTITDTIEPANHQATNDKRDVEGDVHPQEGGGKKDQSGRMTHERRKGQTGSPGLCT